MNGRRNGMSSCWMRLGSSAPNDVLVTPGHGRGDNVAHVQRRAGMWVGRYVGPDGREHSKSFRRKIDADRYLASIEAGKLRGEWVDPKLGLVTVTDAAADWLEAARPTLKTVVGYESLIRSQIVPAIGTYQLSSLKPSDVQDWIGGMQGLGLSPSRIRHGHVLLRQILQRAVMDGRVARNAADGATPPAHPTARGRVPGASARRADRPRDATSL